MKKAAAVITGASSGIGRAYVDAVIEKYPELEEIWLIARRKERLERIAGQYPQKRFVVLGLDLSQTNSYEVLRDALREHKPAIRVLISNSGVGDGGPFRDADLSRQLNIIDVNVKGAIAVTQLCLQYMTRGGIIIETCSVSAFAPTPYGTVYSASKECLLHFSKGLREELKPLGINICALCPGNMDTEMNPQEANGKRASVAAKLPFLDVKKVAATSLVKAQKGRAVYTPGLLYKGYRLLAKVVPHNLIMRFARM